MNRRSFMKNTLGIAALSVSPPYLKNFNNETAIGKILTVQGAIEPARLGFCLPHEHVVSRFGQPPAEPGQYDLQDAIQEIVPYLTYIKEIGVDSVIDCTTAYFGRNVNILKAVSEKSGVHILTNTGIYGASGDRYIPQSAYHESAETIARKWTDEFNNGIYDSGIRPGFIKTGIDGDGISEIDAKLVRAAAVCHRETGLAIAVHTSGNIAGAKIQLAILHEEGVKPEAWIWVHANNVDRVEDLLFAADQGAWISLDGLKEHYYANQKKQGNNTLLKHYELLKGLKDNGFINQVLLSHDGSSYPPDGIVKRPFDFLTNSFIPMLQIGGFTGQEIDQLVKINPSRAFTVRKRLV
jgi:predicted metal-dependent phosphotriesterase family hydrolase